MRELRRELDIHVSGFDPPRPIKTFGQAGFDHLLLGAIKRAGYEAPTAIQAQALPAVLSGRDVLVGLQAGKSFNTHKLIFKSNDTHKKIQHHTNWVT